MTFDFNADKRELVQHYAKLSAIPGWKQHAWFRVNDMARQYPDFYGDMPMLLSNAMAARQAKTTEVNQ